MGIVCSGPSNNFITPTMNGQKASFIEVVAVRISDEGFHPSDLTLYQGQSILFEWNVDRSSKGFNVVQVCGTELNHVPGGYSSGTLTSCGSFNVYFGRKGQFNFFSESLVDRGKMFKVQVLEKPITKIKITDGGFEQQLVNVEEGDTVQWSCGNEDAEFTSFYIQEIEYCFKHGGFIPRKSRLDVSPTHEKTFHDTGLYYFNLEKHGGTDWRLKDEANLICVIRVTQINREFSVHPSDEGRHPSLITARVQDRIWLHCPSNRIHGRKILDAYIYNDTMTSPLVTAKLSAGSSRIAELVSYQFQEPGLYHYVYNMADLSQLRRCVVVQPKPKEHFIDIIDGQFRPAVTAICEKERVWWRWSHGQDLSFIFKELDHCTPFKGLSSRRKSLNSGCGCKKLTNQVYLIKLLGLVTHKFDDIGVFNYHLLPQNDLSSQSTCCSVVVQTNPKHHTVKVHDQGFTPRILNVHPGDWVWWQWEDTKRPHNIIQVSHQRVSMPGGFYSGKPTLSASAFTNVFTELGIFYFASNGAPEVFGAVVVTPESQVHTVDVTAEGIQPDPLVISANDCVSWVWSDGEFYSVQEISQPDEAQGTVEPSSEVLCKRCYFQLFSKPGMYHFLCTAHYDIESEVHSQGTDCFIHSVLVDPVSYSCLVGVTADGFKPSTLTIAKSQNVLWTWENQGDEEHNILHVRPPQAQQPLSRVRGLSAFDSGPKTTHSTFFHTFDVPGRYFITSEGMDRHLCIVDVLENAAYVLPPGIPAAELVGGNVECGYQVFLECETRDAEIFYTTNGSYPAECNLELMRYNKKRGIVLAQAGLAVIRAVAKKQGCVTSPVYTSKRFWVIESDSLVQGDSVEEEAEQHLETGSEEVDLKEEIFKWHWLSCRPTITVALVCDNTFNIDITLGNAADLTWIKGFQLFLNGTPYGGWFSPHCRGLVVSGLIGGKVYHVVLVVFPSQDSFEPQLSNEVVISCPLQASSGGPLVSLEAANTPESLVIVWPAYYDPNTADAATYSVIINGQPFGEQIIPEEESDYCRVLFESSLQNEIYSLCVASHLPGSDSLLYSNEVEFSLPVPEEILSALQKTTAENDFGDGDGFQDGETARELLLVAERVIPETCVSEQSGAENRSLKSVVSKLQTILEDQQLDMMAAEADADVVESVPLPEFDDTQTMPVDDELLHGLEERDAVEGERVAFSEEEAVLEHAPADTSSHVKDEACTAAKVELDATIFRDFGGSDYGKDANLESLVKSTEEDRTASELPERDVGEIGLDNEYDSEKDTSTCIDVSLNQHEVQENGSPEQQVPEEHGGTCHATLGNNEMEIRTNMGDDGETFGIIVGTSSDEPNSDFWDQSEKRYEEDITSDEMVATTERGEVNSHAASQGDAGYDRAKDIGVQQHSDKEKRDVALRTERDHDDVQDDSHLTDPLHAAYIGTSQNSEAGEIHLDTNDEMTGDSTDPAMVPCGSPGQLPGYSEEIAEPVDVATGGEHENAKAANLESVECLKGAIVDEGNAQLTSEPKSSEHPLESRGLEGGEHQSRSDDLESTVIQIKDGKLNSAIPQEYIITAAVEVLQDSLNDVLTFKETEQAEERNIENVICSENQSVASCLTTQEMNTENLTPNKAVNTGDLTTEGDKQTSHQAADDTWSASSSHGSVKNGHDRTKDVAMETIEMPTFEESAVGVDDMFSRDNIRDDKDFQLNREIMESYTKRDEEGDCFKYSLQGEGLGTSYDDNPQDGSEQLLPRPLFVIKGTTPTSVTLEWEWTLLPEQVAGADIVYSVLVLGSKFHSNTNSSFCFNFVDSPVKTMWPDEHTNLKQHAWRTTGTVTEITGLKQRCSYRLAVLGQLMPCANDSLSRVIPFTMPGPPTRPLLHVRDLKDRQVTLTWKPPTSFGDATIMGYRLLKDGRAFKEDIGCDALSLCLSGLEEGVDHSFCLLAVTGHSVGDSKPSNTIVVRCPTRPTSPTIYCIESTTVGSICIAWKREEPASTGHTEKHAQYSYSVFVDGMLHGECPLDGVTDIFSDEHTYTIPHCVVGRKYSLYVKSYLNPEVIDSELENKIYVCGCYGDSSNVLELYCAGPPSPPIVRVSLIDQSGVTLSWSRSREYGGVTLAGYVLRVNGKWSGELLTPEQQETKLTGLSPGDVIRVQMAAVTTDLGVPIKELVNPAMDKSRYFPSSYEPPDSGVESSSSFLSKGSMDDTRQLSRSLGPPLVIQYSNLVRTVSCFEVSSIGCRSASITWSLDETADRSVDPELLSVFCWKTTEQQESAVRHSVKEKPFRINDLEPGLEYYVILECSASHFNDDSSNEQPINRSQSQPISFKTGLAPGPPTNIYVVSATEQSVKLAWESPVEHVVPAAMIQLNVRKNNQSSTEKGVNFHVSPDTCVFNFECLTPRSQYTFTLKVLTEDDILDMTEEITSSVVSFSASTNGVDAADKLILESRTTTSLVIKWQPAVAYGMSVIRQYIVHYVQNRPLRKRSRSKVMQGAEAGKELIVESDCCNAMLSGLEPGAVYRIIVQTVEGLTDYSYDEVFDSEDSDTNSATSSAPSEKPAEAQRLHLSGPLVVCTSAPPDPPVLMVSSFTATQIQLSWNRPLVLAPVVDSQTIDGEDPARGRVRHLKGFRVHVNGRVFARLTANKTNITLKKCRSGMKYTCVVVAMTCPEILDGHQRKNEPSGSAISETDTDDDDIKSLSDCLEESASDPVEVTLPRQDWGLSLRANYCANRLAGSLRDSPCSESGDEEGGVVVRWKRMSDLAGDTSGYRLVWYCSTHNDKKEVLLHGDTNEYEIWSVSPSAVYTIYLEILDVTKEAVAMFGPVHCQTPGPPAAPWIWCRTLSPYQITIEWNEPVTYGDVGIRGYQVYLNDRRLEKLVDRRQRRVAIHCQSSSLYRVSLVALGCDPQYDDSPPSNVLKLCTPVAQDSFMGRGPSGGVKRPCFDVAVNVLSTSNTSISFEWTHPAEILDTADHYIIKWSSVLHPQVQELTLPLIQTCHVIEDCSPGTSHFLVVAAVNADGGLVSRSAQHTVQTSAPVKQPVLKLRSCLQFGITIGWDKPTTFGDAEIDYYKLMVNGKSDAQLDVECGEYKFTGCEPCEQYTFLLKAISTKAACDSSWSGPLVVTCPGAEKPLVARVQSQQVNCISIGWRPPLLKGGAKVESYKVHYLEDKGDLVTSEGVVTDDQTIQHGPLPRQTEEDKLMHVPPDRYYWVMLQVELSPEGCQAVSSEPIRTRAAVPPDPPLISLEVEGLDERKRLEERICELTNKRDRLQRIVHLLENSVVVKGSKQKDLQISKATDSILEVDSELADALEDIKEYTGSIPTLTRWPRPRDDGDAVVSGYQVFVDGVRYGKILSQWSLETRVKLSVGSHVIAVQALTDHPVGPSPLSNPVEMSGCEFLPFVLFCYFDVHKRGESWPKYGCCSWDDSHSYELKHKSRTPGRVFIPRGILARRIPCPVFSVTEVFSGLWRPVVPVGLNKMVALLFWTNWCFSSQKVMEYFIQFAEEFMDKFSFVTCCVRSEEPLTSHRQAVVDILTEREWRKGNNCVTHTCGCHPQSQRTRSARRGVLSVPDVCQLFGLVGTPTLILLDTSGYISWQGRCTCQDATSFRFFLLHVFSQVSLSLCPVSSCKHCELGTEDDQDSSFSEVDENVENPSDQQRRESIELKSLHQRLHGTKSDNTLTAVPLTPRGLKKELARPKTTTAVGRLARSSGYNRLSGFVEPYKTYSRSFSARGFIRPSHHDPVGSGSVELQSRSGTPQTSTESSSGGFSLPVVSRQRNKRTHSQERGSAPRVKTKISVDDFNLW